MSEPLTQLYPSGYETWLRAGLGADFHDDDAMIQRLQDLNDAWVRSADLADYAASRDYLRAYAFYYMSLNLPKLWFLFDRAAPAWPAAGDLAVAELGCGPGTFLWATLFWLRARHPELLARVRRVVGVDRSPAALRLAADLATAVRAYPEFAHLDFDWRQGDWPDHVELPVDLLIFGNVLTESPPPDTAWCARVRAANTLIVEPGVQRVFANVLPVRDAFLGAGRHIAFPCTAAATCPMAGTDNWCHFAINRHTLPFLQRLSSRAGRLQSRHHFTGFLFTPPADYAPDRWRVLSRLRKQNRAGIRWLCDGTCMVEAVVARRERSETTRPFLDATAGDALHIASRTLRPAARLRATDVVEPA